MNIVPCKGINGGFTEVSISARLPKILESMIEYNNFNAKTKERLIELSKSLEQGKNVVEEFYVGKYDRVKKWKEYEDTFKVAELTWMTLPWFFVENYFYRIILNIVGYDVDPFRKQKDELIENATSYVKDLVRFWKEQIQTGKMYYQEEKFGRGFLKQLFLKCLLGNRQDLSISGGKVEEEEKESSPEFVLVDDLGKLFDCFSKKPLSRAAIILDNTGSEFFSDLVLAVGMCQVGFVKDQVVLYCKEDPVFVSDVTETDFKKSLEHLKKQKEEYMSDFCQVLDSLISSGKIVIKKERYYNSPVFFQDMSEETRKELQGFDLVVLKGDANYRRLLSDGRFLEDLFFQDVVKSVGFPTNLVALRTLKSEVFCEMRSSCKKELKEEDRVNGKFGIIQFFKV